MALHIIHTLLNIPPSHTHMYCPCMWENICTRQRFSAPDSLITELLCMKLPNVFMLRSNISFDHQWPEVWKDNWNCRAQQSLRRRAHTFLSCSEESLSIAAFTPNAKWLLDHLCLFAFKHNPRIFTCPSVSGEWQLHHWCVKISYIHCIMQRGKLCFSWINLAYYSSMNPK